MLQTHYQPDHLPALKKPVVTIGTFDGVHVGHRKIIERLNILARESDSDAVLLTFDPHPRIALKNDDDRLKLLSTTEEKAGLLNELGVGHLIVMKFSEEFSQFSEREFVEQILIGQLGISKLVIGFNHRFGHQRQGDFSSLEMLGRELDFGVEEIQQKDMGDTAVSSTRIRNALLNCELTLANQMLGTPYRILAEVIHGEKLGNKLGFPTANLALENPYKLIPPRGVYAVTVSVGNRSLYGMCNIGIRPTFGGKNPVTEVNIFNFDEKLYGKKILLGFIEKLRDEKRFDSSKALIQQINDDKLLAISVLKGKGYDL